MHAMMIMSRIEMLEFNHSDHYWNNISDVANDLLLSEKKTKMITQRKILGQH